MSTFDMLAIVAPLDAIRARLLALGGRARAEVVLTVGLAAWWVARSNI